MSPPVTASIFEFQDYREYLRAVLEDRQGRISGYSLARMAHAFGFSSHSGLAMVLNGKRELKSPYIDNCIKNLGLGINERLYFEAMVRAGSLSGTKRRALLREVQFLNTEWVPPQPEEGIRLLEYGLVHQILCLSRTFMSIDEIRNRFRYPIEKRKIEEILMFMVERDQVIALAGKFKIQNDLLVVKDEVPSVPGQQYHRDSLQVAMNALTDALDDREFQTFLLTVDSKDIPKMKAEVKKFVKGFISKFEKDLDSDTVLQFHFHLFEAIKREKRGLYDL